MQPIDNIMPPRKRHRTSTDVHDSQTVQRTSGPPRKKSCDKCALSKVRCDHRRPICSRCQRRGYECIYERDLSTNNETHQADHQSGFGRTSLFDEIVLDQDSAFEASLDAPGGFDANSSILPNTSFAQVPPQSMAYPEIPGGSSQDGSVYEPSPSHLPTVDIEEFTNTSLISTVDHDRVRNRWMEGFLPRPDQRKKDMTPGMTQYMFSVLRSYPRKLGKTEPPPMIHHLQCQDGKLPLALANCTNICRMWESQVIGGEAIIRETIIKEMRRLFTKRRIEDQMSLLSAFQACVLHAIMLLPQSVHETPNIDNDIMLNLQEFACDIARTGLVCPAETVSTRPEWKDWIVAEAKRRTLLVIYMLDDVFNAMSGLPCILGDELGSLPMTCSKRLWYANSKNTWQGEYNQHLSDWTRGGLRLEELWMPHDHVESRQRIDRWLPSVDELGLMIFAITSATHA